MDMNKNQATIFLVVLSVIGISLTGAVYIINMTDNTTDRVLSIDAVPIQAEDDAQLVLNTENGTKTIETDPPNANITHPDTINFTSLNIRQIPAERLSKLGINDSAIIKTINKAASDYRVQSVSFEGQEAGDVLSELNSVHNGPFIVFLEDSERAVYLQYTITER